MSYQKKTKFPGWDKNCKQQSLVKKYIQQEDACKSCLSTNKIAFTADLVSIMSLCYYSVTVVSFHFYFLFTISWVQYDISKHIVDYFMSQTGNFGALLYLGDGKGGRWGGGRGEFGTRSKNLTTCDTKAMSRKHHKQPNNNSNLLSTVTTPQMQTTASQ